MKSANCPTLNEVSLDHTGHFVPDVEAARAALVDLGFTVTPFSAQVQPDPETGQELLTGTGNICVMLPQGYIEVLAHTADTPIGLEFKAALNLRAGLHLSAFGVADAASRHAELVRDGLDMRPLVHFSREVETDDGHETAAFTVARLAAGKMPEGRVQILTHHTVSTMWQPRWTHHANRAQALQGLIVSSPDPAGAAARFGRFLGRQPEPFRESGPLKEGLRISLDHGAVDFLPEPVATDLVGVAVDPGQSCFVGLRIAVSDMSALSALGGRPEARQIGSSIALPFAPALGTGLWIFETAQGGSAG